MFVFFHHSRFKLIEKQNKEKKYYAQEKPDYIAAVYLQIT